MILHHVSSQVRTAFTALVLLSLMTGCRSALVNEVNKRFPPISSAEHQRRAIDLARTSIQELGRADAYVGIADGHLSDHLSSALRSADTRVRSAKVRSGLQELVAAVDFSGVFPEAKAKLAGTATVHAAVAVDGTSLVLQPSLSRVQLRSAQLEDGTSLDAALPLINAALRAFVNNVNGQIVAQRYPLDFQVLETISPVEFFRSVPGVQNVRGPDVTFSAALAKTAVLADRNGVHVLARLETSAPRASAVGTVDCGQPPQDPSIGCDSNCAVWDVACHARKLVCEVEKAPRMADYRARRSQFEARCGAPVAVTTTAMASTGDVESEHAALAQSFRTRAADEVGINNAAWNRTSAAVTKTFLSQALNRSLGDAVLCADYVASPVSAHIDHTIRTEPAPDLRCQQNARDCTPTRDCSATRDCTPVGDCNPNWGCPDCEWYDVPCHARKAGCEADKQRYRTQCEIEKSARKADCERLKAMEKLQCETEKEAARLDCERLKAMEIAGCQINQDWLNLWGNYEVGNIAGDVNLSPVGSLCIRGIRADANLSSMSVDTTVAASTPVAASLTFTPYNLGNIACLGQWSGALSAHAAVPQQALNFSADISHRAQGEDLVLEITSSAATLKGVILPPPFAALVAQNPSFLVQCAPLVGASRIVGLLDPKNDPFTKADFEIKVPVQKLPIKIAPMNLAAGGNNLTLYPSLGDKSVVFAAR